MSAERRPGPATRVRVREVTPDRVRAREDRLVTEEPLEIRLAWPGSPAARVAVTMRTPGHDFELAAGFLHGEGVLGGGDIHTVAYCTDHALSSEERFNVVTVDLVRPPRRTPAVRYDGPAAASSACGVCGTESIGDVLARCQVGGTASGWPDLVLDRDLVLALPDRLREEQRVFDVTGGLHAAGLFDADGGALVVREDVGRHNTVDKVVGARLLAGEQPGAPLLCVSGRIGFEIVQKAVVAGVGVLVAVGAPTSLAVGLADQAGLTVVGFARGGRYVIYTHPGRIGVGP